MLLDLDLENIVFYPSLNFSPLIPKLGKFLNVKNLCEETIKLLNEKNAGGNSVKSEAWAYQILRDEFKSEGCTSEMNIKYFHPWWKKCDFITRIDDQPIGVSVTRATFKKNDNPDKLDLRISDLLRKKLSGLVIARAGVSEETVFEKSILFVWSPDHITSKLIDITFNQLTDDSLKSDVSLVICQTLDSVDIQNDFPEMAAGFEYLLYY